jgi:ribonuclease HIII
MAFTNSTNVAKLKEALSSASETTTQLTDQQTQFSFAASKRVINVYTTGKVNGQGTPDAEIDKIVEAHIIATNAQR